MCLFLRATHCQFCALLFLKEDVILQSSSYQNDLLRPSLSLFFFIPVLVELPERVFSTSLFCHSKPPLSLTPFFHCSIKHVHKIYFPPTIIFDFYTTINRQKYPVCFTVEFSLCIFITFQIYVLSVVKKLCKNSPFLQQNTFAIYAHCEFHGLWSGSHFALGIEYYKRVAIFRDVITHCHLSRQPLLPGRAQGTKSKQSGWREVGSPMLQLHLAPALCWNLCSVGARLSSALPGSVWPWMAAKFRCQVERMSSWQLPNMVEHFLQFWNPGEPS